MSGAERKSSHQYTYAKVAEGDDAPNSGNGDILDAIFADSSEVSDIALNDEYLTSLFARFGWRFIGTNREPER